MDDIEILPNDLREIADNLATSSIGVRAAEGGCWVAALLIDGRRCYSIGGPGIDDDRIFANPEAALAALAHHLVLQAGDEALKASITPYRLAVPEQREISREWMVKEVKGAGDSIYLSIGPVGSAPELQVGHADGFERAWSVAHHQASQGLGP